MDFKVITEESGTADLFHGEDAGYALKEGGVLVAMDESRRVTYGSSGWLRIEQSGAQQNVPASLAQNFL
jgi:hypothetical protein